MTRLRPLVIPVAALSLAAAAPSAAAQPRRPVSLNTPRAAHLPRPVDMTAVHANLGSRAASVQAATSLPIAALATLGEAVTPDGRRAAPAPPATVVVAGRPILQTARGPPR